MLWMRSCQKCVTTSVARSRGEVHDYASGEVQSGTVSGTLVLRRSLGTTSSGVERSGAVCTTHAPTHHDQRHGPNQKKDQSACLVSMLDVDTDDEQPNAYGSRTHQRLRFKCKLAVAPISPEPFVVKTMHNAHMHNSSHALWTSST